MEKVYKVSLVTIVATSLVLSALSLTAFAAVIPPDLTLGITSGYSVYGHAGITNTGGGTSPTRVWGNVGDNNVGGDALTAVQVPSGIIDHSTANGTAIESDASSVYDSLMSATQGTPAGVVTSLDLAGTHTVANGNPITPGVYDVGATTLNGAVELSGAGVYIFRSSASLTIATSGGTMTLSNGAVPCNVWWAIPVSMTIGTGSIMAGTIIAQTGLISLGTGATLVGRAISLTKAVTLDANQITQPTCSVVPPPAPSFSGGTGAHYFSLLPHINITKVPSPFALPTGSGPVTYTYQVTNQGTAPMHTVWVTDDKCSPVTYVSGDTNKDSILDLNETWTYDCFKTVSQTETNTATAHGYANGMDVYDTANATVAVGTVLPPPLIHLTKVPSVFVLPAGGGAVTYSYAVTNPGIAPLSDVSITDDKCTGLPGRVVGHPGDINKNNLLDPGETWQFTCQSNITQTTTNIGTAEGHANGLTAIDISPATVVVNPPGLPNTGLPPFDGNTLWSIAMLVIGVVLGYFGSTVIRDRQRMTSI